MDSLRAPRSKKRPVARRDPHGPSGNPELAECSGMRFHGLQHGRQIALKELNRVAAPPRHVAVGHHTGDLQEVSHAAV